MGYSLQVNAQLTRWFVSFAEFLIKYVMELENM